MTACEIWPKDYFVILMMSLYEFVQPSETVFDISLRNNSKSSKGPDEEIRDTLTGNATPN